MNILTAAITVAVLLFTAVSAQAYGDEALVLNAFDKDACIASCGCAFGMFTACEACKRECERKYWEEWDKEMGTEQPDKGGSAKRGAR